MVHEYDVGGGESKLCVWMNVCLVCVRVFECGCLFVYLFVHVCVYVCVFGLDGDEVFCVELSVEGGLFEFNMQTL